MRNPLNAVIVSNCQPAHKAHSDLRPMLTDNRVNAIDVVTPRGLYDSDWKALKLVIIDRTGMSEKQGKDVAAWSEAYGLDHVTVSRERGWDASPIAKKCDDIRIRLWGSSGRDNTSPMPPPPRMPAPPKPQSATQELERELAEARAENERLKAKAQPNPKPEPEPAKAEVVADEVDHRAPETDAIVCWPYKGTMIGMSKDDFVDMTAMWRANGKPENRRPVDYLKTDKAKRLIEQIQRETAAVVSGHRGLWRTESGGVTGGGCTKAFWKLAIDYGMYLNPEFHSWCLERIGNYIASRATGTAEPDTLDAETARFLAQRMDVKLAAQNTKIEAYRAEIPAALAPVQQTAETAVALAGEAEKRSAEVERRQRDFEAAQVRQTNANIMMGTGEANKLFRGAHAGADRITRMRGFDLKLKTGKAEAESEFRRVIGEARRNAGCSKLPLHCVHPNYFRPIRRELPKAIAWCATRYQIEIDQAQADLMVENAINEFS